MTIRKVENEIGVEKFLADIKDELREDKYGASSIKRVYIPKANGKQRPLGIPAVRDRIPSPSTT